MRAAPEKADVPDAEERVLYDLRHTCAVVGITKLRMDPATLPARMGNGVVCLNHSAKWFEGLSPLGAEVFSWA